MARLAAILCPESIRNTYKVYCELLGWREVAPSCVIEPFDDGDCGQDYTAVDWDWDGHHLEADIHKDGKVEWLHVNQFGKYTEWTT